MSGGSNSVNPTWQVMIRSSEMGLLGRAVVLYTPFTIHNHPTKTIQIQQRKSHKTQNGNKLK